MSVRKARFAKVWSPNKQIRVIFIHLKFVGRGSEGQVQVGGGV